MRDIKGMKGMKGLHVLRTMRDIKRRSMPRIKTSAYLDLFILSKEKERLMKEKDRLIKENERLCMRKDAIEKRLEEMDLEMNRLQQAEATAMVREKESSTGSQSFTQRNDIKKEWKRMPLNY